MHIVIWFKEGTTRNTPIYSFDSRDKSPMQGKHWADESVLGGRAHFQFQDKPAKLTVDSVKDGDAGIYHCRVDFKQSRTRNVKVNLTIILPPEKLSILDERGVHIPHYILGPYNEGTAINITCVATGGRPTPKVTWWQENALLDDTFEFLSERRVRNILHLDRLERKHLHTVFTCQASNNNMITPISSSVTLEMNLRPLWVKLIGENRPLSANKTFELSCEVVGSRPPPTITWWKGSQQMKNTREMTSPDSNRTTSVLTYVPTVDDAGKYLSCRGQQQQIPDSGIEDGWKLDIQHVPLVTLELGSNLNGSTIREGVDVYFECNIKSNPWVYKVSWQHNNKPLHNNPAAGTIVSNQSLVLQMVTRTRAGFYTCIGSNQEGEGESNTVELDVKFAPICRPGQSRVYGVARQEMARIPCELEANPADPQGMHYTWKFNSSAESIDIPQSHVRTERTRSVAVYTPITEDDYGTLLCWGKNEIGTQKDPCVFNIIPAGKPDPVANCTILNQTADSLQVLCKTGFNGGLKEEFIMEVYDTQSNRLVGNVSTGGFDDYTVLFAVFGLESGLGFNISIYVANVKGRSPSVHLQAFTLKSAEKHIGSTPVFLHITPILGTLIGIVAALILLAVIIVIVIRLRDRHPHDDKDYDDDGGLGSASAATRRHCSSVDRSGGGGNTGCVSAGVGCRGGNGSDKASTEPLNKDLNDSVDSLEEKNPDIIPLSNGDDDYLAEERAFERLNTTGMGSMRGVYGGGLGLGRLPSPNNVGGKNGPYDYLPKTKNEDLTYADLTLTRQQSPHVIYSQHQQAIPMSIIRRPVQQQQHHQHHNNQLQQQPLSHENSTNNSTVTSTAMNSPQQPTIYAQIDTSLKRLQQPLSPPHPAAFAGMQMHHLPPYMMTGNAGTLRHHQHQQQQQQRLLGPVKDGGHHDGGLVSAETPLINPRDTTALQPLLDANCTRTPTITSTTPRVVTATRF